MYNFKVNGSIRARALFAFLKTMLNVTPHEPRRLAGQTWQIDYDGEESRMICEAFVAGWEAARNYLEE